MDRFSPTIVPRPHGNHVQGSLWLSRLSGVLPTLMERHTLPVRSIYNQRPDHSAVSSHLVLRLSLVTRHSQVRYPHLTSLEHLLEPILVTSRWPHSEVPRT